MKTNTNHVNRFGIRDQLRIAFHRSHEKRTARRHDPPFVAYGLCYPAQSENQIGTPVRQDIDAHPILRTSFELPNFIDVRSQ